MAQSGRFPAKFCRSGKLSALFGLIIGLIRSYFRSYSVLFGLLPAR